MRTAEFEVVEYNTPRISYVSGELIHDFARYSKPDWAHRSQDVINAIHNVLEKKKPDQVRWQTPGLTIFFSGIPSVLPRIEGEKLVYVAAEPHFVLEENVEDEIHPKVRTRLEWVADTLAQEMEELYRLRVSGDRHFRQLTFPKDVYARSIERFQVPVFP